MRKFMGWYMPDGQVLQIDLAKDGKMTGILFPTVMDWDWCFLRDAWEGITQEQLLEMFPEAVNAILAHEGPSSRNDSQCVIHCYSN